MSFERIKKKLGFGLMRLPMAGEEVDTEQVSRMVDLFLEKGFNYFDTAHGYIGGRSERAVKTCLTSRYSRDRYILTDKLSTWDFETEEEVIPLIERELAICGVEYFDFVLMHAMDRIKFEKYTRLGVPEKLLSMKAEGKIRHIGISFHDTADILEEILKAYDCIEVVQLQINYLDMEDPDIQSRLCYETCLKYGKKVIVMEPVKGGKLALVPDEAKEIFGSISDRSPASYAIRFAAGLPGVIMVLSGMSAIGQMEDNVSFMEEFRPLDEKEQVAVSAVKALIEKQSLISCTACRYCVPGCPAGIPIPDVFAAVNSRKVNGRANAAAQYETATEGKGKASECLSCGACEEVCPQKLPIRELLAKAAKGFERK